MNVFFDSSVLVPVVTDQLPNHPAALAAFVRHTGGRHVSYTSGHALAECYATLTALPLSRRISGPEALRLIEANFIEKLNLVSFSTSDTTKALRRAAGLGRISGQVYDALHVVAAEKNNCKRIYTYNLNHFRALAPSLEITTP